MTDITAAAAATFPASLLASLPAGALALAAQGREARGWNYWGQAEGAQRQCRAEEEAIRCAILAGDRNPSREARLRAEEAAAYLFLGLWRMVSGRDGHGLAAGLETWAAYPAVAAATERWLAG